MLGYPSILYKESIGEVMMKLRHHSVTCIIFLYFITVQWYMSLMYTELLYEQGNC
jgi:hypothetical protein